MNASKGQVLLEASARAVEATHVLGEVLRSTDMSAGDKRKLALVASVLEIANGHIKSSASGLGGAGTSYAAARMEAERKRELYAEQLLKGKAQKSEPTPQLKSLENYASAHKKTGNENTSPAIVSGGRPIRAINFKRGGKTPKKAVRFPTPENNTMYNAQEIADILAALDKSGQKISPVVKTVDEKGWVPCGPRHLYKLMDLSKNGKSISAWGKGGRKPIASPSVLEEVSKRLSLGGHAFGKDEMKAELEKLRRQQLESSGLSADGHTLVGARSVKNYMTLASGQPGFRPAESAVYRSEVREVAGNSLRSALSFAMVTAVMQIQPGAPEKYDYITTRTTSVTTPGGTFRPVIWFISRKSSQKVHKRLLASYHLPTKLTKAKLGLM